MRLDLFLKASRIVLRRTIARQLCDAGAIKVNAVVAKPSKEVSAEDEIEIKRGTRITTFRIMAIPTSKQVSKVDATSLFEVTSDVKEPETLLP